MLMLDRRTYGHMHEWMENWLPAHPLIMLYICTKVCESISKGFRVTDLNNWVYCRGSQMLMPDGWTRGHMHKWMENWIPVSGHA